jgi:glycine cleavage system H lipoate-binding protein
MQNKDQLSQNLWPSDEQPCIWMDAGVVSYKLCDRNYDCENCPFNASMQSRSLISPEKGQVTFDRPKHGLDSEQETSPLERILSPYCQIAYDPSAFYGAEFWSIKPKGTRTCRIGLNDLGLKILPTVEKVIFPQNDSVLEKNDPFCKLVTREGPMQFSFPVDGKIRFLNKDLLAVLRQSKNGETVDSWFAEFDLLRNEELAGFKKGAAALDFLLEQQNDVVKTLISAIDMHDKEERPTLQDGGVLIPDIKTIIGSQKYYRLAVDVLCQ